MSEVKYIPSYVIVDEADAAFNELWDDLNWERRRDAPRREFWTNDYSRDYTYGRGMGERTYKAQPCPRLITGIRDRLVADNHAYFEGCFLNGYENSKDWLGWHADDDPSIDHSKPIAIITLYGGEGVDTPRVIQFREVFDEDAKEFGPVTSLELEHGSLCLMPPGFQFTHHHRIPKAGFDCRQRISLTFRSLLR